MNGFAWSSTVRALAWVLATAFFISAVVSALLAFQAFGPPPERGDDFIEYILESFRWEQGRWPIELVGLALTAVGFIALGALGPALQRLTVPGDGRRGLVGTSFLSAGLLGVASQLVWIGTKPLATSSQYCDCGLLQEEIMSRLMILNVVGGIQGWLLNGGLVVLAVGLLIVAELGHRAGMPSGWRLLSRAIAALSVISVALSFFEVSPVEALLVLLIAGVLAPVWALWLARRASILWLIATPTGIASSD